LNWTILYGAPGGLQPAGFVYPPARRGRLSYTRRVTFRVVLEYDPVAQSYSAVCPELPGCASAGETEAEARRNIEEAIRLYLAPTDLDLPHDAKVVEVVVG